MSIPSANKPARLWPYFILLFVVALAGTGYYLYQHYLGSNRWKPLLQSQLKELVIKASDSLYHIEYSDFDLDLASGNANLNNFKLVPDTAVYLKLLAMKKAPDDLFILSVKKLSVKNMGALQAYQQKILNIDDISIENPELTVIHDPQDYNDTVKIGRPKTPFEVIKKVFKQLHINTIGLHDINLSYINKGEPAIRQTAIKHLDINISDLVIDSVSATDPQRFYYTKGVEVKLHHYRIATADSLYYLNASQIYFSTAERRIILDTVSLQPRYSKTAFYKKTGQANDRFDLRFKQIAINDINLQLFLRDQKLYAGTMDINNADVEIYTNNAYKGKKSIKTGKDPHQQLQKLAFDLNLSRLNLYNSTVTYAEADAVSGYTGVITFNRTNGTFFNVTNDANAKKRNHFMKANINTRFMNVAPLLVNFKFNLAAKDGAFNYSGTLGKFDGRVLDKLVKPLALIHVESADIEKLHFDVDASNYAGKGRLEFFYRNLKVDLLTKDSGKTELRKLGFISKLANNLVIERNNPSKNGVFRLGPINLKREPSVSFFSFLYQALLEGLKPSVGYDKKTEDKVNHTIAKVSSIIDKFKKFEADRKTRRQQRQKERADKKAEKEKIKADKDKAAPNGN